MGNQSNDKHGYEAINSFYLLICFVYWHQRWKGRNICRYLKTDCGVLRLKSSLLQPNKVKVFNVLYKKIKHPARGEKKLKTVRPQRHMYTSWKVGQTLTVPWAEVTDRKVLTAACLVWLRRPPVWVSPDWTVMNSRSMEVDGSQPYSPQTQTHTSCARTCT